MEHFASLIKGLSFAAFGVYVMIPLIGAFLAFIITISHYRTEICNGTRYVKGCGKKTPNLSLKDVLWIPFCLWMSPFWVLQAPKGKRELYVHQQWNYFLNHSFRQDYFEGTSYYCCPSCWVKSETSEEKKNEALWKTKRKKESLEKQRQYMEDLYLLEQVMYAIVSEPEEHEETLFPYIKEMREILQLLEQEAQKIRHG